ncbi:MAG: branched-chain amino acid ABC transporter permease, partial [Deltaproteobacteria bacterium]
MHATLRRDALVGASLLLVLLLVPVLFPQPALRDFLIYVMAYGLLALSLNLLIGLTGLVAFGLLMQSGHVSIPAALLLAVLSSALLALAIGAVCVRLKDIYFSFITLAFQMFLHSIIITWVGLTGGDQGLQGGIPRPPFWGVDLSNPRALYATCAVLFVVCIAIMRQVWCSPFGNALRMIRDNPA